MDENEHEIDDWNSVELKDAKSGTTFTVLIQHGQTNKLSMSMIYGTVAHSNILYTASFLQVHTCMFHVCYF